MQAIHLRGAVGLQIDRQPVDDDQHVQRHAAQALRDQLDFRFQQRVRAVRPVQARDVLHEGADVGEDELRVDALVRRVAVVQHANEGALALGLDQRDQPAVLFDEAGELCVAEIRPDDIDRFVVRKLHAHLPCQLQFPDFEPALLVDQGLQPVFQPLCVRQAAHVLVGVSPAGPVAAALEEVASEHEREQHTQADQERAGQPAGWPQCDGQRQQHCRRHDPAEQGSRDVLGHALQSGACPRGLQVAAGSPAESPRGSAGRALLCWAGMRDSGAGRTQEYS